MKKFKLVLMVLGLFVFSVANAQVEKPNRGERPQNGEKPSPEKMFQKHDLDGDGGINFQEFTAAKERRAEKKGSVNASSKDPAEYFAKIDTSGDQLISFEEFMRAKQKRKKRRENKNKP